MFKGSYFIPNIFIVGPTGSCFGYDWLVDCTGMDSPAATRPIKNLEEYTRFLPQGLSVEYFFPPPVEKGNP